MTVVPLTHIHTYLLAAPILKSSRALFGHHATYTMMAQYSARSFRRLAQLLVFIALAYSLFTFLVVSQPYVPSVTPLDFGGIADGVVDDTQSIQAAIDYCSALPSCWHVSLTCPSDKGSCKFLSGAIWLESHLTFDVALGATLLASTDPEAYPFIYSRFEGTLRFGHAGLINAGKCIRMKASANTSSVLYPAYPGDGDMCAVWQKREVCCTAVSTGNTGCLHDTPGALTGNTDILCSCSENSALLVTNA